MTNTEIPDLKPGQNVTESPPTRRNILLELGTAVVSFLLVAVPSTIGGIFFLDPILRSKKSSGGGGGSALEGFIKLPVTAETIPADGTPVAVTVKDDLDDAWNRFKDVPVGSIWLRKNPDGQIVVFNSVCPHLGCSVNFRRSENDFFCPCHTSSFSLDGCKTNEIPPRDMDSLSLKRTTGGAEANDGEELWVKFQNFRRATSDKIPI
jgi:menaquinol-cytochrome c reductase iron-sulfur subunit